MTAPSAKPLFRAISGKPQRSKRAATLPHMADLPEQTRADDAHGIRRAGDFYPSSTRDTDPINALLAADGARITALGTVWENACGDGALVKPMRAFGLRVIATDITDRGCPEMTLQDFLTTTSSPAPAIITNPPYDLINARDGRGKWLRHSLGLPEWRYMALLLSWDWPAAKQHGLGQMLDETPFSYCYLMRWKIDFTGAGSPPQRNAWFVWDRDDPRNKRGHGPHQEPAFRFLDRPRHSAAQATLI